MFAVGLIFEIVRIPSGCQGKPAIFDSIVCTCRSEYLREMFGITICSRPLKSAPLRDIARKQYPADFFNKQSKNPHGSFEVVRGGC